MRRFIAWPLILLLAPSLEGVRAASEHARRDPSPSGCALSVASDPLGATVYLNGEARGVTPLSLGGLPPGNHRVKVVKLGYLENSRVLSLRRGAPGAVQVKLTPHAPEPLRSVQVDDTQKTEKKGGGKKALWIGLGVLGAGAATYLLLPKNEAPVPGTIGVSPTGTGLMAVTSFSFTSQGSSDPDGDPLTYSWNFGDGGTGSGETASHLFATAGSFSVSLTISDGKKSTTAPAASVAVRDVNGTWVSVREGTTRTWVLSQSGTRVSGSYSNSAAPGVPGTVTGALSPPRAFNGTSGLTGFIPFLFNGQFNDALTSLSGVADQSGFANTPLTFNRQ